MTNAEIFVTFAFSILGAVMLWQRGENKQLLLARRILEARHAALRTHAEGGIVIGVCAQTNTYGQAAVAQLIKTVAAALASCTGLRGRLHGVLRVRHDVAAVLASCTGLRVLRMMTATPRRMRSVMAAR